MDTPLEKPGGGESPFFAVGYLYFDSLKGFQKAFNSVGSDVTGNIHRYTDVRPVIQVGEVRQVI